MEKLHRGSTTYLNLCSIRAARFLLLEFEERKVDRGLPASFASLPLFLLPLTHFAQMTSRVFPRVGDEFDSMVEAKIAAYTAACTSPRPPLLRHLVDLCSSTDLGGHRFSTAKSAKDTWLDLACPLSGPRKKCRANLSFRLIDSSSLRVKVISSCERHSCSSKKRWADTKEAQAFAKRKLEDLEAPIPLPPPLADPPLESSSEEGSSSSSGSGSDDEPVIVEDSPSTDRSYHSHDRVTSSKRRKSSRRSKAVERFGQKKARRDEAEGESERGSSGDESSDEGGGPSEEEQQSTKESKMRVPDKSDLRKEIEELVKVRPLSFVTCDSD
jgi:hypothetical protein